MEPRGALVSGDGLQVAPLGDVVQAYAWGSRSTLASLRGLPVPSPTVEAELWFGAHVRAPSRLERRTGSIDLDRAIALDPAGELGAAPDDLGARLPFLVKLLAIAHPLSIQLHPVEADALEGFRDEERRGVAVDAAERSFPDPWGKSELLLALEPTVARIGVRGPDEVERSLEGLGVGPRSLPGLAAVSGGTGSDEQARALLAAAIGLSAGQRAAVVAKLVDGARALLADHGDGDPELREDARTVLRLDAAHPGDLGILLALLLRPIELAPGQAVEVPAGVVHSYQHGMAAEVMVASDCVLRLGLTRKHVDAEAALGHVRTGPAPMPIVPAVEGPWTLLPTGIGAFRVASASVTGSPIDPPTGWVPLGPSVLVCLAGDVEVASTADRVRLGGGRAAFVSARATDVTVRGRGSVLLVAAGARVQWSVGA